MLNEWYRCGDVLSLWLILPNVCVFLRSILKMFCFYYCNCLFKVWLLYYLFIPMLTIPCNLMNHAGKKKNHRQLNCCFLIYHGYFLAIVLRQKSNIFKLCSLSKSLEMRAKSLQPKINQDHELFHKILLGIADSSGALSGPHGKWIILTPSDLRSANKSWQYFFFCIIYLFVDRIGT